MLDSQWLLKSGVTNFDNHLNSFFTYISAMPDVLAALLLYGDLNFTECSSS